MPDAHSAASDKLRIMRYHKSRYAGAADGLQNGPEKAPGSLRIERGGAGAAAINSVYLRKVFDEMEGVEEDSDKDL